MWWRRLATSVALVIALMAAWSYGVGAWARSSMTGR